MILGMLKYLNLLISENDIFKDTAGVITSVALKATVSRRDSCDLEADKVKDEITNVNSAQCEYFRKMFPVLTLFDGLSKRIVASRGSKLKSEKSFIPFFWPNIYKVGIKKMFAAFLLSFVWFLICKELGRLKIVPI